MTAISKKNILMGLLACIFEIAYASGTPIRFTNDLPRTLYWGYTENGHWHGITSVAPGATKGVSNPPRGAQFSLSENKNNLMLESDGGKATYENGVYSYTRNVTVVKYDGNDIPTIQQGLYLSSTYKASGAIYSKVSILPIVCCDALAEGYIVNGI